MSEAIKRKWEDPEYRKKRNESHRKTCEEKKLKKLGKEDQKTQ